MDPLYGNEERKTTEVLTHIVIYLNWSL
jgi:hypothetical protein